VRDAVHVERVEADLPVLAAGGHGSRRYVGHLRPSRIVTKRDGRLRHRHGGPPRVRRVARAGRVAGSRAQARSWSVTW
jgi:hypothetical protein